MKRSFRPLSKVIGLLMIAAMLLSACGGTTETSPTATTAASGGATGPTAVATAPATAATGGATAEATPAAGATETTSGGGAQNPGTAPKDPNTMVEATTGDPESFDPAWAYDTASGEVLFNVYETLLFTNKEKTTDFVPMLATKWDVSPDGKTYTFTIRKGVKFQGGQDLTPEDVAYSFQRGMIQDRSGGPQWIMLQPFFGLDVQAFFNDKGGDVVTAQFNKDWVKACGAVQQAVTFDNNAGTVTMHLKQPYGPMLQILTGSWASIISKSWAAGLGDWDGNCADAQKFHDPKAEDSKLFKTMNGTGPFKLDHWTPGEEVGLTRNDNYWVQQPLWAGGPSGPAKVKTVLIKNIKEWGTRFSALKAGDADIAYVDRQYIPQVDPLIKETCEYGKPCTPSSNPNSFIRVYTKLPTVSADTILFNQKVSTQGNNRIGSGKLDGNGVPPDFFSDVNIRKAFSYCFDWDTYIKQVYLGEAEQALGPIINGELGYNASQAKYSFDLGKCADSFKASTLKSDSGQSVWDTGFKLDYVYNEGNDQRKTAGEILKDSLSQVNPKFQLNIATEPWPAFLKDTNNGTLAIFMLGWLEDFHDPHDWVFPYLSSGGAYAGQQSFPADLQKTLDSQITQAVATTDPAERTKIYEQLQNTAYEQALDIWLVQPYGRHYEQMWVQGYYYNPIYPGIYFYPLSK